MQGLIFERGPSIFKVFKEHNLYRFVQIKVHWKTFHPFSPLHFLPEFVPHTEFKGRLEDTKWNVLYHTALRNYAAISLQVPSILSILLAPKNTPYGSLKAGDGIFKSYCATTSGSPEVELRFWPWLILFQYRIGPVLRSALCPYYVCIEGGELRSASGDRTSDLIHVHRMS